MRPYRPFFHFAVLFLLLTQSGASLAAMPRADQARESIAAEKYLRTEVYFGRNIPGGGTVSEEAWDAFVDEVITPRFPDGLTILDADGQWLNKDGSIAREKSKVLVLVYPRKARKSVDRNIEELRREYKARFRQEAVMRIDLERSVTVTF
ncbi:MAG: DUF3574 domain-containing protein [Pyrinomonadaceae bacterium]